MPLKDWGQFGDIKLLFFEAFDERKKSPTGLFFSKNTMYIMTPVLLHG